MEKFPEGQVYVPKLKPSAPIRLADRNRAHYPSRHCTILLSDLFSLVWRHGFGASTV